MSSDKIKDLTHMIKGAADTPRPTQDTKVSIL
jgi:hypothetical protein